MARRMDRLCGAAQGTAGLALREARGVTPHGSRGLPGIQCPQLGHRVGSLGLSERTRLREAEEGADRWPDSWEEMYELTHSAHRCRGNLSGRDV